LHNYFIIHDIKYFFLNKINQTIQGGQKNFSRRANYRKYYRKALFFKIQGGPLPPRPNVHPPLDIINNFEIYLVTTYNEWSFLEQSNSILDGSSKMAKSILDLYFKDSWKTFSASNAM
jgi:hypothetical protein